MERYEAYKDSGVEWIGEIPEGWETCHAKWLVRISNGSDPNTEGEIPVYGSSGASFKTCGEFKRPPAVLLGRKGTIDSPSYIDHPYWNVDTAFDATAYDQSLALRYYFYLSACFDYPRYQTSTAIPSMTQSNYRNMNIPVPPFDEQRAIADFLDAETARIDGLVADCEREVELLQEYRKAVISEAVTKGLDPHAPMKDSGVEWIGEIPEGWNSENLGAHSWMLTPMRDKPENLDGPIPWVRIEDYDGKYISASKEGLGVSSETIADMNLKVYPVGTLLCTSSCDLGKCAIVTEELVSNQRFIGIVPTDYDIDYLYYLMLSNADRLNFLSTGTIQANLSRKSFEHLKLPFPTITEQESIATYLDTKTAEIDGFIEAKRQMAEKLREYRKSLISEAATGKFKVPGVA